MLTASYYVHSDKEVSKMFNDLIFSTSHIAKKKLEHFFCLVNLFTKEPT